MSAMETVAQEIGLILRTVKGLHQAAVTAAGVRVEQPALQVLGALDATSPLRPSALADALHLDLSSVSRQVAALERDGWVSRRRDPGDSRAALLELTPLGRDVLARVRAGRVALLTTLLPDWSDEELADFAAQLHRFRTDLTRRSIDLTSTPTTSPTVNDDGTTDRTPALAGQENR
ncbi:MAG TPA: MarR family transcriptional regulator [Mycobacteriales bacterium]|jgi:DNA-binding MarR family transcriptional regulator|nr:MarR family transcriptional regulator [Mycobacteriales bacterium]